jgi:uncharacterized phage-associated protein
MKHRKPKIQLVQSYQTLACTNYIIENINKNNISDLTNLKLQKLLYFAYGVHLSLFNQKLFDSKIEAWQHGPVIPEVYQEFKLFGKSSINIGSRATILNDDYSGEVEVPIINEITQENYAKSLFVACASYDDKSAWDLVELLHHGDKSTWKKHYNQNKKGVIIPDEDIILEFEIHMDQIATNILG